MRAVRTLWLAAVLCCGTASAGTDGTPEFTHRSADAWLNSAPLKLAELRGNPVLVEFWTYGCSNCLRTLPWLKDIHARYAGKGLAIVSVHTPEFPHERDIDLVRAAVDKLGIRYPVMIDNDFSYWRALGNRYWPAFYLLDGDGRIVARAVGELHGGQRSGDSFEGHIRQLVGDP